MTTTPQLLTCSECGEGNYTPTPGNREPAYVCTNKACDSEDMWTVDFTRHLDNGQELVIVNGLLHVTAPVEPTDDED